MHVTAQLFACEGEKGVLVEFLWDQERTDVIVADLTTSSNFMCSFLFYFMDECCKSNPA